MNKKLEISLDKAKKLYGTNDVMDEMLLTVFSEKELIQKPLPKTWEEILHISGYYITNISTIEYYKDINPLNEAEKCIFPTSKHAKSALAMAQLSQLLLIYNDGWEPDWTQQTINDENIKYCICRYNDVIIRKEYQSRWSFLAFKSSEIREEFIENFSHLIRDYFML